jgi:putative addiction module antidote
MTQLKVRPVGNSLGVVLPKEILTRLNLKSGDHLHLTEAPDGAMRIAAYDPRFEAFSRITRAKMRELLPGVSITEQGITFERLANGDGLFSINVMVDGKRIHRNLGQAAGLDPKRVVRHTLTHAAITHPVQTGVDLPTVKRISGHKTMVVLERYAHRSGAHIAEAMDTLDDLYRSAKKPA